MALSKHGLIGKGAEFNSSFKVPASDQLSIKRVDPAKLEVSSQFQIVYYTTHLTSTFLLHIVIIDVVSRINFDLLQILIYKHTVTPSMCLLVCFWEVY